nr:hypothetical protein [uncultured bacterium]
MNEQERRRQAVAHVQGCQALEGLRPTPAQHARLQRYVNGESIEALLSELRDEQRHRRDCE